MPLAYRGTLFAGTALASRPEGGCYCTDTASKKTVSLSKIFCACLPYNKPADCSPACSPANQSTMSTCQICQSVKLSISQSCQCVFHTTTRVLHTTCDSLTTARVFPTTTPISFRLSVFPSSFLSIYMRVYYLSLSPSLLIIYSAIYYMSLLSPFFSIHVSIYYLS